VVAGKEGYRLGSVIKPTLWPCGEPLVAECLRASPFTGWMRRRRGRPRPVPDPECACGIYAAWLPDIGRYLSEITIGRSAVARVLGQVSLWGSVIECERGFRAELAYPLRLFLPLDASLRDDHHWDGLLAGLETYGVPVEPLAARCADAVAVLEQRQLASLSRPDD
jgi:hypothetical protein